MKKIFFFLAASLAFLSCTVKAPILSTTYSLTLPSGAGVNSNLSFTDFASSASGGKTTLLFTNNDGDVLQFVINGLHGGNSYDIGDGKNTMTGSFTIIDEMGAVAAVQVENGSLGTFNAGNVAGSGASITGMTGSFSLNIKVGGTDDSPLATTSATGTIVGNISFNK